MPFRGAPGLVAARRSTATPRLNLPKSRILISRSPPPGALTTVWISSALTMVTTSLCENAVDGASTAVRTAAPSIMRDIATLLDPPEGGHYREPRIYAPGGVSPRIFAGLI